MMKPFTALLLPALCCLHACSPKVVKSYSSYFADYNGQVYSVHTPLKAGQYRQFVYYYPDGTVAAEGLEKRVGKDEYRADSFFRAYDPDGKLLQHLFATGNKIMLVTHNGDETIADTISFDNYLYESRSYYPNGSVKSRTSCRMPDNLSFFGYYHAPAYGEHPARRKPAFPLHLGIFSNEQKLLTSVYPDIAECTNTSYHETGIVQRTGKNTGHIRFYDVQLFDEEGKLLPQQTIPDTMAGAPNWDNMVFWNSSKPGYDVDSFIRLQLHYPAQARDAKVEGRVIVRVLLDKTGKITDGKVSGSSRVPAGYGLEEEALRVVSKLPDWQPPIHQAQSVKTYVVIPVMFKLAD